MMNMTKDPVSIVIPMYNAEKHIVSVLEAIFSQDYGGRMEVIVVNDGSNDRSRELIRGYESQGKIRVIDQPNQGAVTSTNNGFQATRYDFICSIDSDVVLHQDWLKKIMKEFDDPLVGAVQGYYLTPKGSSFLTRMMGYDVERRYDGIVGRYVSQVCTGDTAYRRSALEQTGLFDPVFVYGYDNDMSYRLVKAGYKLVFEKEALCDHYWKADLASYVKQQYRSAYGRMQLIKKHKDKITGDSVSGTRMILQVPFTMLFFILLGLEAVAGTLYNFGNYFLVASFVVLCVLLIDRFIFAAGIIRKQRDLSALLLPFIHMVRNAVWCWAAVRWVLARVKFPTERGVGLP